MKISLEDNRIMKKDDIKEEVYKCSKCGLCQSVCPLYLATKNEMYLPRGRYIVLNGFFNLKNKLSKKFIKDIDICLNCNACKNFCPSNIDSYKIFTYIKNQNKYRYSIINFSAIYRFKLLLLSIAKFLYKMCIFKSLLLNTHVDLLFNERVKRAKSILPSNIKGNVVYFEGCFNKYINGSDKNASLNLIEKTGYKVQKIVSSCCGYPYINEGNYEKFRKNAENIINSIKGNCDYIVCSCDSCYDTLKRMSLFVENANIITDKLIRLDEFLKLNNFNFVPSSQPAFYFKPLLRKELCFLNKNVVEIKKKGLCSLMENFFVMKYPLLAKKLIESVSITRKEYDDKTIITSCLLSKWGLLKGIKRIKSNARVLMYSEYAEISGSGCNNKIEKNIKIIEN